VWLEADVNVTADGQGTRSFAITMKLHAQDRYNFNPGALDIGSGTPDAVNGRFEVTGLGKEFMDYGTLTRKLSITTSAAQPRPAPQRAVMTKKSHSPPKPTS